MKALRGRRLWWHSSRRRRGFEHLAYSVTFYFRENLQIEFMILNIEDDLNWPVTWRHCNSKIKSVLNRSDVIIFRWALSNKAPV